MKYFVVRADITKAGTEANEVKSFNDYDEALKFYHLTFANNINQEQKVSSMLTDENLNVIMKEVWVAQEEPETEETEE